MFHFRLNFHEWWQIAGDSGFPNVCDMCSVSVANDFFSPANSERLWIPLIWWVGSLHLLLFQKIKQRSFFALLDQWDEYVLANCSKFPSIANESFLSRTRVLRALNKIGSSYWRREFQRHARRFLEEFTNSVLSTVAVRSRIGQWLSCFCPAIIIVGDNHASLQLLGLLLDGLLERGWIKGSEIEACRPEY